MLSRDVGAVKLLFVTVSTTVTSGSPDGAEPFDLTVLAPAKVNLVLRVLGRRADGYHDLETLMLPVSLCDQVEMRVTRAAETHISCEVLGDPTIGGGPDNLACRAASSLLDATGVKARVEIRLTKKVPHGAGLGGGSSDAAAVLKGITRLLGLDRAKRSLYALAASLGADVPFFLPCRPSWATGVGERLEPVPGFPSLNLVVVMPAVTVPTAWAYREALGSLTSRQAKISFPRLSFADATLGRGFHNDFELGVARAYPDVARIREILDTQGARATVLSGSGAAMVGLFDDESRAKAAAADFQAPDRAWAVKILRGPPRAR